MERSQTAPEDQQPLKSRPLFPSHFLQAAKRVRHLPVVDRGRLMGLVSIGDLVKDIISEHKQTIRQLERYVMGERG